MPSSDDIALGPWGRGQGLPGVSDQGGMLGFMPLMADMMKLRQTQQEWNARSAFGQITSTSKTLDEALERAQRDPNVTAWMPQLLTELKQQRLLDYQTQMYGQQVSGERIKNANSGVEAVNQAIMLAGNDMTKLGPAMQSRFGTLPGQVQADVMPYGNQVLESLTGGMEGMTGDEKQQEYLKRRAAFMIANKLSPDAAYASMGGVQPQVVTGPYGQGGAQQPVMIGGPGTLGGGGGSGPSLALPTPSGGGPSPSTPAPGGGIPLGPTSPSLAETEQLKKTGDVAGTIQEEMTTAGRDLPSHLNRLDVLSGALEGFQAGGGADARANVAKSLQAVRGVFPDLVPQSLVDSVGNQSLSDTQLFSANIKPFVTGMLREAAQGTGAGRIRSEVEAFLKSADETTDPRALIRILNQAKYTLQVETDRAQNWPVFNDLVKKGDPSVRGYGPADYYTWWNQNRAGKMSGSGGPGLDTSPYSTTSPKGTQPKVEDIPTGKIVVQGGVRYRKQQDGSFKEVP